MPENTIQEKNAIRAVLRNEITWIIFIIGLIWGAVQTVILPLQSVQIGLAQVQSTLVDLPQIKQDDAVFKEQQANQDAEIDAILKKLNIIE